MLKSLKIIYNLIDGSTRRRVPLAFLIILLLGCMEVFGIGLIFPCIQSIIGKGTQLDLGLGVLLGLKGIESGYRSALLVLSFVFGLFILKNVLSILLVRWQSVFLSEADFNLSTCLMKKYMDMPYVFYFSKNSVDMTRNIMVVVTAACSSFLGGLLSIAAECVLIIGVILTLLLFAPVPVLSISFFIGTAAWAFQFFFKEKSVRSGQAYLRAASESWKKVIQTFLVVKELRVLGREQNVLENFYEVRKDLCRVEIAQKFIQLLPRYFLEIVFSVAAFLFCLLIFEFREEGTKHVALLGVASICFIRLVPSVNRMLSTLQLVRMNIPSVEALKESMQVGYTKELASSSSSLASIAFLSKAPKSQEGLVLKDVSFVYPGRVEPAVKEINFTIQWGESIGLVGESGAGKSTLFDIILGLLPPSHGQVLLDGEDLFKQLIRWRSCIGYVPQSIHLWDDTILRNITLGIPEKAVDREALQEAVRLSNAASFIDSLPKGLDTLVGEDGMQLSGGQRQCIGMARALYSNPSVLMLDEATSSVDNKLESQIVAMLEKLYQKKTLIIIAHRLSTVYRCDKIVFMEKGCISAVGTFDFLRQEHAGFKDFVELNAS